MYGSGAAETLIAEAIAGRRDEVFLVSKVLPHQRFQARHHCGLQSIAGPPAHRPAGLLPASLARQPPTGRNHRRVRYPGEREGKILSWGVSNFDVDDLDEVATIAGAGVPACNQVLYHLQERAIEHAVMPWCREARHCTGRLHTLRPIGDRLRFSNQARPRTA